MTNAGAGGGPTTVYLGLGSNLGDREANLLSGAKRLSDSIAVVALSSIYETEPVGCAGQPLFLNAVLAARTDLGPLELLQLAKRIEKELGRVESLRNAPRELDIDILFHGDKVVRSRELTVPHPRMDGRAFVLVPLAEIAPRLVHPLSGRTITDLLAAVHGIDGVRQVGRLDLGEAAE